MKDQCGREIGQGDIVHMMIDDIMACVVVSIEEGGLADAQGRVQPARLVLNVAIPLKLNPGTLAPVYVVRSAAEMREAAEAEKKKEQVM